MIVFDGYLNNTSSIKGVEHDHRALKNTCADIIFDENMTATANKDCFIQFLQKYFEKSNIHVEQAEDDADLRIVQVALQVTNKIPVIVAEDIDIFVLLSGLTPIDKKVYLLKPGKDQNIANVYSSQNLNKFLFCNKYILFFHAATGCDTTSSFFGKDKKSMAKSLKKK